MTGGVDDEDDEIILFPLELLDDDDDDDTERFFRVGCRKCPTIDPHTSSTSFLDD